MCHSLLTTGDSSSLTIMMTSGTEDLLVTSMSCPAAEKKRRLESRPEIAEEWHGLPLGNRLRLNSLSALAEQSLNIFGGRCNNTAIVFLNTSKSTQGFRKHSWKGLNAHQIVLWAIPTWAHHLWENPSPPISDKLPHQKRACSNGLKMRRPVPSSIRLLLAL